MKVLFCVSGTALMLYLAAADSLLDKLNKAYFGMTTEEIIRMALTGKEGQE